MTAKIAIVAAALFGATGVMLGAFGAHALRDRLEPRLLETFQTAVDYQLTHSLALLLVGILIFLSDRSLAFQVSAYGFIGGILLFSGSLYGLVLTGAKWLGPVTPLGGLLFIAAWVALAVGGLRHLD